MFNRLKYVSSILILPTGCKPDEAPTKEDADLWVGRIVELRARHEHDVRSFHGTSIAQN